jgi:2-keto-4-pentenoate hydratase
MPRMTPADRAEAASWIASRRIAGTSLADMPRSLRPADPAEGYAVARLVRERLIQAGRGTLVGWKVGATTPVMQKLLAVPGPCAGAMLASGRLTKPARVEAGRYVKVGFECEVAVRLAKPLGPEATRADAEAAIAAIHPAIEIVDNRFGDFVATGPATLIADDFFHAGFVLGPEVRDWRGIDLARAAGVTRADGIEVQRGKGADVLGHPFESLVWLARHLGTVGERLEAGQIVMTGSLPLPHWAAAGQHIEISIDGLGTAEVTLAREPS